jgi:hypothetical protein
MTMVALKDLEVKAADVQNVCLTAPVSERMWTRLGPEFGSDRGNVIIARALQGLKSPGASFRNHLADCMREMGHVSCKADADVWLKPKTRPDDGFQCHSCMLCCVDDVLATHHNAMTQTQQINKQFPLKADLSVTPTTAWGLSSGKQRSRMESKPAGPCLQASMCKKPSRM